MLYSIHTQINYTYTRVCIKFTLNSIIHDIAFNSQSIQLHMICTQWVLYSIMHDLKIQPVVCFSFVAPISGQYFFSVVAIADGTTSIPIILLYRQKEILSTSGPRDTGDLIYPVGVGRMTLTLSQGDSVEVRVKSKESGFWGVVSSAVYSKTDVTVSAYKLP